MAAAAAGAGKSALYTWKVPAVAAASCDRKRSPAVDPFLGKKPVGGTRSAGIRHRPHQALKCVQATLVAELVLGAGELPVTAYNIAVCHVWCALPAAAASGNTSAVVATNSTHQQYVQASAGSLPQPAAAPTPNMRMHHLRAHH